MIESLRNASPADIATLLLSIKLIGQEKNWIRKTQITHIDLILSQLYREQAKVVKATNLPMKPRKAKKENTDAIQ